MEQTAIETKIKIVEIKDAMDTTQQEIKDKLPGIYSKDLVEFLFDYPYCKRQFLENNGIGSKNTSLSYLHSLEKIGIVISRGAGRELYFINRRLLNILKA